VIRKARITARLQHPQVIAVHDVVLHHGYPCLIMKYLPSRSLASVLSAHGVLIHEAVAQHRHPNQLRTDRRAYRRHHAPRYQTRQRVTRR
jgi:serine/threonine protein kinase